jgi:hypothetical protein
MEGSVPLESYGVDEYKQKFGSFLAERERRIKQEEKVDYNFQTEEQLQLGKEETTTDDTTTIPSKRLPKVLLAIASTNMNSKTSEWDFWRRHCILHATLGYRLILNSTVSLPRMPMFRIEPVRCKSTRITLLLQAITMLASLYIPFSLLAMTKGIIQQNRRWGV